MARNDIKSICVNIKKYREELDLTQEKLSEKAGITQDYLSEIERGKYPPSLKRLYIIAKALDIDVYKLLMD